MSQVQYFILVTVVSPFLLPILGASVAPIGLARARHTVAILSGVALVLYIAGEVGSRVFVPTLTSDPQSAVIPPAYAISSIAHNVAVAAADVGLLLALIRTAQTRRWLWFSALLMGALVSPTAQIAAANSIVVSQLVGSATAQALFKNPIYVIVTSSLVATILIVQLLYGIFGPNDRKTGENPGVPSVAGGSTD